MQAHEDNQNNHCSAICFLPQCILSFPFQTKRELNKKIKHDIWYSLNELDKIIQKNQNYLILQTSKPLSEEDKVLFWVREADPRYQ